MIEKALAGWAAAGVTSCPIGKAIEFASGPHATPARVQTVIEAAEGQIAAAKARGRRFNAVGWLINGLGVNRVGQVRPAPVPMQLELEWQRREVEHLRQLETLTALQARIDAARAERGIPSPIAPHGFTKPASASS